MLFVGRFYRIFESAQRSSKAKVSDSELESGDDGEDQVAPDNEVTKLKIVEQKEEIVQKDDADIKPEKEDV